MGIMLVELVNRARIGDGIAKAVLRSFAARIKDTQATAPAWPSVETLALELEFSERAIQYAMQRLQAGNWISKQGDGIGGRSLSTRYRLNVERLRDESNNPEKGAPRAPFNVPERAEKGAPRAEKGAPRAEKGAPRAPEPKRTEKNLKGERARKRATPPPDHVELTDKLIAIGQSLGMDRRTVEDQLEQCLDWHRANGKSRTDWQATYRNWLKKSVEYQTKRNGHRHPAPPPGITWPAAGDFPAWLKFGQQHGIRPNRTESEADFVHRVRIHLAGGHRHA